jgi:hypothetical protein
LDVNEMGSVVRARAATIELVMLNCSPQILGAKSKPSSRQTFDVGFSSKLRSSFSRAFMAKCEVCGNDYDKSFSIEVNGVKHVFDSFECAIQALAPEC